MLCHVGNWQLPQNAQTVSIAASIWMLPSVSNLSRHQGTIQPDLKGAKFQEQELQIIKVWHYWRGH